MALGKTRQNLGREGLRQLLARVPLNQNMEPDGKTCSANSQVQGGWGGEQVPACQEQEGAAMLAVAWSLPSREGLEQNTGLPSTGAGGGPGGASCLQGPTSPSGTVRWPCSLSAWLMRQVDHPAPSHALGRRRHLSQVRKSRPPVAQCLPLSVSMNLFICV